MAVTMAAREFNQNVSKAVRAARKAPVTITERGKEAFVLLNIDDYRHLNGESNATDFMRALAIPDECCLVENLESDADFDELLMCIRKERSHDLRVPDFDEPV